MEDKRRELNYDYVVEAMDMLQEHVRFAEIRKGHINDGTVYKCFLLMEEIGEMVKAIRLMLKMRVHSKTAKHNLEDEAGDVLFLFLAILNRSNINAARALLNKIEKDNSKVYAVADGDEHTDN